jgi:menaquinone-dependent protoporphyrinogen oxidase
MLTTPPSVLVTYGSRFGSTREIADRIGARLRRAGHLVDVRAVEDVHDVEPYAAVVLGSGVYNGSWTPSANDLIGRTTPLLARRAVWLFSVGTLGDRHPVIGRFMRREPRGIAGVLTAVKPRDYRVFAGVIDGASWPATARLLLRLAGGGFGDRRDWADIDAWSDTIARDIGALAVPCCPPRPLAAAS